MKSERFRVQPMVKRSIGGFAGIIGKAAVNEEFRKRFIADPVKVADEYGLPFAAIEKIKGLDRKALEAAIVGLKPIAKEVADHSSAHSSGHSSGPVSAVTSIVDPVVNR